MPPRKCVPRLSAIVQENMTDLVLTHFHQLPASDMPYSLDTAPLARFAHLHTLDLNFYDSHNPDLLEHILTTCGHVLERLIFNVCADYRTVVNCHNIIASRCPNLTSLTFVGDYENPSHIDSETDSLLLPSSAEFCPHSKLEQLTLGGYCTDARFAWILRNARNIKHINLDGNLEHLSDHGWSSLMTDNPLASLESIWFNTSTAMTIDTVNKLLDSCPLLNRLGRLVHLAGHEVPMVRRSDYLDLVERTRLANWDMELVWVTPTKKT